MIMVTEEQAKARLGALVKLVEAGEIISITRDGKPVARLEPEPVVEPKIIATV